MKRRLLLLLALPLAGCIATPAPPESTATTEQATTSCGQTTVKGVDVSHYDGTIDWTQAKAAGISFAFAKATQATDFIDPDFAANWSGMKAAGVVRGAYHFFDPTVDAASQATYCLQTVGTLEAGDLPIVLDFEELNGVAEATAVADAVTFLASVTKSTGKTAILYMSSDFLSGSYSSLSPYTLWVANYGVSCPGMPSEFSTWSFWQYSDSGTVSGISDAVDEDYYNGTLAQLTGSGTGSSSGSSSGSGSGSGSSSGSGSGSGSGGGSTSSGSSSGSGGSTSSGSGSGSGSGGSGSTSSGGSSSGSSSGGTSSSGLGGSGSGSSGGVSADAGHGGAAGGDAGAASDLDQGGSGGAGCSISHRVGDQRYGALFFASALAIVAGARVRRRR